MGSCAHCCNNEFRVKSLIFSAITVSLILRKNSRRLWRPQSRNPGAFPKAEPFSLTENAQNLAGMAFGAAGKLGSRIFQQRRNLPENFSRKGFLGHFLRGSFFPEIGRASACRYRCGNGGEGSCGGVAGGFCCSVPSMGGVREGEEGHAQEHTHTHTRTHTGTYTRMLHLPFSDLPLKKCPNFGQPQPSRVYPLTQNYYLRKMFLKLYYLQKLRISRVIPQKSRPFPEILRAQNPSKIAKNNSQGIIFVIILCQRASLMRLMPPMPSSQSMRPSASLFK